MSVKTNLNATLATDDGVGAAAALPGGPPQGRLDIMSDIHDVATKTSLEKQRTSLI